MAAIRPPGSASRNGVSPAASHAARTAEEVTGLGDATATLSSTLARKRPAAEGDISAMRRRGACTSSFT